jgi:hypothetical protein
MDGATNQTLWLTHRICQAFVLPRANFKGGVPTAVKHARGVVRPRGAKVGTYDLIVKTRLKLNPKYRLPSAQLPAGSAKNDRSNMPRALVTCS